MYGSIAWPSAQIIRFLATFPCHQENIRATLVNTKSTAFVTTALKGTITQFSSTWYLWDRMIVLVTLRLLRMVMTIGSWMNQPMAKDKKMACTQTAPISAGFGYSLKMRVATKSTWMWQRTIKASAQVHGKIRQKSTDLHMAEQARHRAARASLRAQDPMTLRRP